MEADLAKEFINYGVLGALVIWLIWTINKYTPKLVEGHLIFLKKTADFLDRTEKCTGVNVELNRKLSEGMATLLNALGNTHYNFETFSTVHTNRAIAYLARAAQELSTDNPNQDKARSYIEAAISELKGRLQEHEKER